MKGASVKLAILSFFSRHGLFFHQTKIQPLLRPPSTFSEHWLWFWPYLFSEKVMKLFWYKIWVIIFTKSAKFSDLGIPWVRNNRLLLHFFWRLKTLLDTLTYSAVSSQPEQVARGCVATPFSAFCHCILLHFIALRRAFQPCRGRPPSQCIALWRPFKPVVEGGGWGSPITIATRF